MSAQDDPGFVDARLSDRDGLARLLAEAARLAAAVLLARRGDGGVRTKADGSPVCSADLAADHVAKAALARLLPGIPVISEESVEEAAPGPVFILLDPLDGTREFLAGGDSYCVLVALISQGRPLAGAIAAPRSGRLWFGGDNAFTQAIAPDGALLGEPVRIHVRPVPEAGPVTLVSRFHGDALSDAVADGVGTSERLPMSSAVKFGLIAAGEADFHVRGGQTMEWDIAAGDAVLTAAGGIVLTFDGDVPVYGRSDREFRNPPFLAASDVAMARRAITLIAALR